MANEEEVQKYWPLTALYHRAVLAPVKPSHLHQLFQLECVLTRTPPTTLAAARFLGVMNAADYYGLDELKCACSGFIQVFPVYTHVA